MGTEFGVNELAVAVRDNTCLNGNEIKRRVEDIVDEYSPLVGREAALFILADEQGFDLREFLDLDRDLGFDLENLVEGMSDICVDVEVENVGSVNEYGDGRVVNVDVYDGTGKTKLVFWDDDVDFVSCLSAGDELRVEGAYSKYDDYKGMVTVHVGGSTEVRNVTVGKSLKQSE